jgi:ATP-dependent protease HslVU (ClpYQ) ATPase subunit
MAALMEEILFELPEWKANPIVIDAALVREKLGAVLGNDDLRRYIL